MNLACPRRGFFYSCSCLGSIVPRHTRCHRYISDHLVGSSRVCIAALASSACGPSFVVSFISSQQRSLYSKNLVPLQDWKVGLLSCHCRELRLWNSFIVLSSSGSGRVGGLFCLRKSEASSGSEQLDTAKL